MGLVVRDGGSILNRSLFTAPTRWSPIRFELDHIRPQIGLPMSWRLSRSDKQVWGEASLSPITLRRSASA